MTKITERVTGHTELIGLIAKPIRHSLSPSMHNEAFKALGLDYCYMVFEVDNSSLKEAVTGLKALGVRGWNVSMPNKIKIIDYLDELDDNARLIGAVNTVVNNNGVLKGYNTDGIGAMTALKASKVDIVHQKITVMGAGGAATAIIVQAALDGVKEISVFNRKDHFFVPMLEKIKTVSDFTGCKITLNDLYDRKALHESVNESVCLINATSVGMTPNTDAMALDDYSYFREDLAVFDCIYAPGKTKFLDAAIKSNCKVVMNGEGMMLYQGAAAFKLWTGKEMPVEHIKDVLDLNFNLKG